MEQLILPGMKKYMKPARQARVNRNRGKAHQKKVAAKLNGLDLGTLGAMDGLSDDFIIEAKSREKFVGLAWYEQAAQYRKKFPSKVPIVVIHANRKSYDNDLVLLKLSDLLNYVERSRGV